jgi:hypothetical protein
MVCALLMPSLIRRLYFSIDKIGQFFDLLPNRENISDIGRD